MAEIRAAFAAWRNRCDSNSDNIAVFYFCGHGVEKSQQHLLAEDFGGDDLDPWLGAFDFDSTRLAFHTCRARTQCFFVDACRRVTSGMLTHEPNKTVLGVVDWTAHECHFNLTIKAVATNEKAHGPKRGVAYFTQALVHALGGAVATRVGNEWVIHTGQVAAHISTLLRRVRTAEGYPLRCPCQVTDSVAIRRVGVPQVELTLECRPVEANPHARLSWQVLHPPGQPVSERNGAPVTVDVDAGLYLARAGFVGGHYRDTEAPVFALPPFQRAILECSP